MAEPEVRRRRRPAVSCTLCRRRKIRCNRGQPCSNCLRARKNVTCTYEDLPPLAQDGLDSAPPSGPTATSTTKSASSPSKGRSMTADRRAAVQDVSQDLTLDTAQVSPRQPPQHQTNTNTSSAERPLDAAPNIVAGLAPEAFLTGDIVDRTANGVSALPSAIGRAGSGSKVAPAIVSSSPFDAFTVPGQPYSKPVQQNQDMESMQQRIQQLEGQLHEAQNRQQGHGHDHESNLAGTSLAQADEHAANQMNPMSYLTLSDAPRRAPKWLSSHRSDAQSGRSSSSRHSRRSGHYHSQPPRSLSPPARSALPRHARPRPHQRQSYFDVPDPRPVDAHDSRSSTTLAVSDVDKGDLPTGGPIDGSKKCSTGNRGSQAASAVESGRSQHPPSVEDWPAKQGSIAADFYVSTDQRRDGRRDRRYRDGQRGNRKQDGQHGQRGQRGHRAPGSHRHSRYEPQNGRMHMTSRSVMHKTRLFGQSHWVNSIVGFRDIFEMIDPLMAEQNGMVASKVFSDMQRLKHLGRVVKAQRVGAAWRALPAPVRQCQSMQPMQPIQRHEDLDLPPRELADELIGCYLRSTESIYRILHVPMFRREYEALWQTLAGGGFPGLSKSDSAFLAQLKLVLAIGAATHRDYTMLRQRAVRWFYAAQAWLAEPEYKAHLTMQTLQIHILLLFAREATSIGGALIWIGIGDLLRSAMYMGLHRDPTRLPKCMSRLAVEMRRRLWNTILELAVMTSLDSGGPVMLSLSDYDTKPPENLDDAVLEEPAGPVIGGTPINGKPADPLPSSRRFHVNDSGEMYYMRPHQTVSDMLAAEKQEGSWQVDDRDERDAQAARDAAGRASASDGSDRSDDGLGEDENVDDDSDGESMDGRDDDGDKDNSAADIASPETFTQMSVAIALRKTLPVRLAICRFVNDIGPPGSYADTLHLDRQFRAAYRGLCETLQQYNGPAPASATVGHSAGKIGHFTLATVDLLMRRYLLCLHVPFFGAAMHEETTYAYSRRIVVDTAVRVWHTSCPGIVDKSVTTQDAAEYAAAEACKSTTTSVTGGLRYVDPELVRQTLLGAGPLRRFSMQASLIVAAEIKSLLMEDDGVPLGVSMGPPLAGATFANGMDWPSAPQSRVSIRPDLLDVIDAASHWCLRAVEAGETNFKGYLLWRLVSTQLDGMRRGMMGGAAATVTSRMALARELVRSTEDAEAICMPILEKMVATGYQEAGFVDGVPSDGAVESDAASAETVPAWLANSEIHALVRACRAEDCPCQVPYRQQREREQREQRERQEREALAEQQQLQVQAQMPFPAGALPNPIFPMTGQAIDPMQMDLTIDNWEFLMPDPQSADIGGGEPMSWLFSGDMSQGILW